MQHTMTIPYLSVNMNAAAQPVIYKALAYMHLSNEDKKAGTSESIESQRIYLEQWAREQGIAIVDYFADDGVSGTTFNRPQFLNMLEALKAGRANMVLCKDLSRLGRDIIESTRYQEIVFPEMGVRLVAPGDMYDSNNADNSMATFQNMQNDWYARDISKKTRLMQKTRARAGEYIGATPYGYIRDPEDKHRLLVDEPHAEIVRRIFKMSESGKGYQSIVRVLREEGVPTPARATGRNLAYVSNQDCEWQYTTIKSILTNPVYLGHLVYGRKELISYKVKKLRDVNPEDWIFVPNTHEAIVSESTFENVQRILQAKRRDCKSGEPHMFAGLLHCSDCGTVLARNGSTGTPSFCCLRYKRYGTESCSSHYLNEAHLHEMVLEDIRELVAAVREDKEGFVQKLSGINAERQLKKCAALKKERQKAGKRLEAIPNLIQRVFEQNAEGTLSDDVYRDMVSRYTTEREQLAASVQALDGEIAEIERETECAAKFVKLVAEYTNVRQLDRELLHNLIDRIVVYQRDKGTKSQRIDIYYRFVGMI